MPDRTDLNQTILTMAITVSDVENSVKNNSSGVGKNPIV